jgi:hypothetical protein
MGGPTVHAAAAARWARRWSARGAWLTISLAASPSVFAAPAPPTGEAPTGEAPTGEAPTGDAPTGDAPTGDASTGDASTADPAKSRSAAPTKAPDSASIDPRVPGSAEQVAAALANAHVEVVVLPVELTVDRGASSQGLARRRAEIEALLADSAQDLGLALDVGSPIPQDAPSAEHGLAELARRTGKLVVLATIHVPATMRDDGLVELRLAAARPDSRALLMRIERTKPEDLPVRSVVMLRDIVTELGRERVVRTQVVQKGSWTEPAQSMGRSILAVSGTAYGGYIGLALQRASGSDDPRLLYPLVGVGAGVGLGAAFIVADEWDVGVGDAWYLTSGAFWPAVGSQLVYLGRVEENGSVPEGEQWAFSLVASATGLGLATVGLLRRGMGDGGAALALSGGGAGMLLGGMAEMMVTGSDEAVPLSGMGYGAMGGWLVGAATAIHLHPDASQVLAIDLGVLLGTAGGAAAASPLLLDSPSPAEVRGWIGAAFGGMAAGTALAAWLSSSSPEPEEEAPVPGEPEQVVVRWGLPMPTILVGSVPSERPSLTPSGLPRRSDARREPALGVAWSAELW